MERYRRVPPIFSDVSESVKTSYYDGYEEEDEMKKGKNDNQNSSSRPSSFQSDSPDSSKSSIKKERKRYSVPKEDVDEYFEKEKEIENLTSKIAILDRRYERIKNFNKEAQKLIDQIDQNIKDLCYGREENNKMAQIFRKEAENSDLPEDLNSNYVRSMLSIRGERARLLFKLEEIEKQRNELKETKQNEINRLKEETMKAKEKLAFLQEKILKSSNYM